MDTWWLCRKALIDLSGTCCLKSLGATDELTRQHLRRLHCSTPRDSCGDDTVLRELVVAGFLALIDQGAMMLPPRREAFWARVRQRGSRLYQSLTRPSTTRQLDISYHVLKRSRARSQQERSCDRRRSTADGELEGTSDVFLTVCSDGVTSVQSYPVAFMQMI